MITQENRTWLDENDIFDRHIFDRLTDVERTRLQRLLADHPEVREEMELHQMIAAGLRQQGRLEMKRRLQDGLRSDVHSLSTSRWMYMKIAAAAVILLGSSLLIYKLLDRPQQTGPVAQDEVKKDKETPSVPKEEKIVPDMSRQLATKKSGGKPSYEQKPILGAAPAETIPTFHNQKFKIEASMIPKLNEIKVPLRLETENREIESKILFKNPIDLSAVNIKETQGEQNGKLAWFYVFYENRILNVYLDNSKYLSDFKNASLTESGSVLTLQSAGAVFTIDLASKDKFKKASMKP